MDFELSDEQRAIVLACEGILGQLAGVPRAMALAERCAYDAPLEKALCEAGFLEVALGDGTGALEAALVTEATARAAGVVAVAAAALVAPGVVGSALAGPVALVECAEDGSALAPARYASEARSVLALRGEEAFVVETEAGRASPVHSSFGYPFGAFAAPLHGTSLGAASGSRLRAWWQVALAVETVGTMDAALAVTLGYVKERRQFGRAIGSFQAVQHRLAECAVWLEGARWLAYEAAALGAPGEGAATAAAHAAMAAKRVFAETHQLTGAIGYTREHDLHVFSMRLQALRLELGGVGAHRQGAARARWGRG